MLKWFVTFLIAIALIGGLNPLLRRVGLGRLPGDVRFVRGGREYSFPPAFIDKVNQLGQPHGITAEYVTLSGSPMDEPQRYKVIVDRISHEVEYYRGFLKLAVLNGTYVINNPFWWTADDKFFNYSVVQKLGVTVPKTVLLPQKGYPWDVDIQPESLHQRTPLILGGKAEMEAFEKLSGA